jgi:hypothetical protein
MITARTTSFEELTKLVSDFVTAQRGMWDHAAWMLFLSHVEREGVEISEDMQSKLGDLLEAMKECNVVPSAGRSRRAYPKVRQDRSRKLPS